MSTWMPTRDPAWILEQEGFDPSQERLMESLFAIGNGYIGVRGSPDFLIPGSQADLFIAGVFDKKANNFPYSEPEFLAQKERENPFREIVPFPFPFRLELRLDGRPVTLTGPELTDHSRTLDLRQGIYFENFRFRNEVGRTVWVRTFRCASLADPNLLMQQVEIHSENYAGLLEVELSMAPQEVELAYPHLGRVEVKKPHSIADIALYRTSASHIHCCFSARLSIDGSEKNTNLNEVAIAPGKVVIIRKLVSVASEVDLSATLDRALSHAASQSWETFDDSIRSHVEKWTNFWEVADIEFVRAPELTHSQRFNLYHLRIPARRDTRTSIGARALTGRAYEGHVFWDTTIFMFPFYLYTQPDLARELMLYRYHTLDGARDRAKSMGYSGACYAWESTLTGEDVTPRFIVIKGTGKEIPIFTGTQQIHVTADVAFSVWKYWDATLDENFLEDYGAEILIETARFWASRSDQTGSLFHIRQVVGPDEYHSSVNDNAYTNWMARFNLEKAVWAVTRLIRSSRDKAKKLLRTTRLSVAEVRKWKEIARSLAAPRTTPEGVIEQFDGFFDLKAISVPKEQRMRAPISRLLAWEEINRAKLVKQADVLMIPFLFPDQFSRERLAANYDYYEPMTDHGSSLSSPVHAAVAARAGRWDQAEMYWEKSLDFDLKNAMRNTPLGIHVGCIGGTWQALVFHMLGVRLTENGPTLPADTWLPSGCTEVDLVLFYRGRRYPLHVKPQRKATA